MIFYKSKFYWIFGVSSNITIKIQLNMKSKIALWCFFVIAFAELCGEIIQNVNIIYVTKPLLMISLSTYFFFSTIQNRSRFSIFILLGLIFSIGGDTFLMFEGSQYFMLGLGCFLITHLLYIAAFLNYESLSKGLIRQKIGLILPFLLYLIGILSYLWQDLAEMMIPVIVYSTVICLMAITALNLKSKLPKDIFIILFGGVLLFMLSDSIIALNKFKGDTLMIPYHRIVIMTTYIIAQYLIAKSSSVINKDI